MRFKQKLIGAVAAVGVLASIASSASAAVYTPVSTFFPTLTVPTDGLIGSFFVADPGGFPSQNLATVENFLETNSITSFSGLTTVLTGGVGVDSCGNTAGFNCTTSTSATSNLVGNVFDIHIGAGNLIFIYDTLVSNFSISYPNQTLNIITNSLLDCGGQDLPGCGTGLSNIRVFTNDGIIDQNPDVPLPAGAWLLISGLAGMGYFGRRKKANA
jgi:hypothetical protein